MDHCSIIDRTTFEVYKHSEDYDKLLAPAVALLNKKGYKTYASCQGHYKNEFYEYFDEDIENIDEVKKNKNIIITNIKEKSFDFIKILDIYTYILFDSEYKFNNLPKCFDVYTNESGRTGIESFTSYYDENDNKKPRNIVEKEIEDKCNKLLEWADKLPELKGNDKYE